MQNRRSTKDNVCPRGDLNTDTGAISPDLGNHAARIRDRVLPASTRFPETVMYLHPGYPASSAARNFTGRSALPPAEGRGVRGIGPGVILPAWEARGRRSRA